MSHEIQLGRDLIFTIFNLYDFLVLLLFILFCTNNQIFQIILFKYINQLIPNQYLKAIIGVVFFMMTHGRCFVNNLDVVSSHRFSIFDMNNDTIYYSPCGLLIKYIFLQIIGRLY